MVRRLSALQAVELGIEQLLELHAAEHPFTHFVLKYITVGDRWLSKATRSVELPTLKAIARTEMLKKRRRQIAEFMPLRPEATEATEIPDQVGDDE